MVPVEGAEHPAAQPRPAGVSGVLRRARRGVRAAGLNQIHLGAEPTEGAGEGDDGRPRPDVGLHRADRVRRRRRSTRDIANLKAALEGVDVVDAFLPGRRAGERLLAPQRALRERRGVRLRASRTRCTRSTRRSSTPGSAPGRRRGARARVRLDPPRSAARLEDYRRWAELRVDALNHALEGIPEDRVRYHICCGSWHGPHAYDPPLSDVLDLVLQVNAGALLDRAGERRATSTSGASGRTSQLPDDKVLVPGVVTHHTTWSSTPSSSPQRLVRLARLVGRERVMGGTDCGFAQGAVPAARAPDMQWAKLAALAEGAQIATASCGRPRCRGGRGGASASPRPTISGARLRPAPAGPSRPASRPPCRTR